MAERSEPDKHDRTNARDRRDDDWSWWDLVDIPDKPRRTLTWVVGMGIGLWETVTQDVPRAAVYAFAGSLIGVPELLARLRRREEPDDRDRKDSSV